MTGCRRIFATARPGPDFDALPFSSLYLTGDEWAAEIANQTMHGVMHMGWVEDGTGGYRGQMAVLVKPNGLLGRGYMAAIKPFRHLIVYPRMIRGMDREWRARSGARGAQEAGLAGLDAGLDPGAAVELGEDVAHVHVDRARAEEELGGDLAVGAALGDQPHDLELAPRERAPSPSAAARPSRCSADSPSSSIAAAARPASGRAPSLRASR